MQKHTDTPQIELRQYTQDILAHSHDHHQLVMPIKGVLDMEIDGMQNEVMMSKAAVIGSGQPHSCASTGDNSFLIIDIPSQKHMIKNTSVDLWNTVNEEPFVEFDQSVLGYCNFLATEMKACPFSNLDKSMAAGMLVNALARCVGIEQAQLPPALAKAMAFIEAHYDATLTIKDIARASGTSESRLHTLFKSQYNVSPMFFIAKLRVKHAAFMLEKTNLQIVEIAQRVGYSDQSAFTRAFQRHMGITPAKFRKL